MSFATVLIYTITQKDRIMELIKKNAFFIMLILFISCSQNKEELSLELHRKIGDEQTIVSMIETSKGSLLNVKNIIEVKFIVSSIDNTVYTLKSDVLSIKTEINMNGDVVESYDSEKEVSQMTADEKSTHLELKNILDPEFEISIDKSGKIIKSFHLLNGEMIDASIMDMSNIQLIFPEKKVRVGSRWENEKTNPITQQKTKSIYRIKDITDKEIIISVNSTISEISGLLDKNTVKGKYILDKKTCNLIKGSLEMSLQTGGKVTNTYFAK